MKRLIALVIVLLCVITTGCRGYMGGKVAEKQSNNIDNQPVLEWETVEQETNKDEAFNEEANAQDDVINTQFPQQSDTNSEINDTYGIYKGNTYTFYKADYDKYTEGHWIRGVYDEEMYEFDSSYHGLFVGQVVTMFGDESVTYDNESLISYIVAAEDSNGEVIYLEVYYGPSGPAIGGRDGDNYDKAAEELEQIIINIDPIDFECVSIYNDAEITLKMGTKNGKGFYETIWEEY